MKVSSGWRLWVYLSGRVAIVEFIFISQSKLFWEFLLHLVIRHLFTHSLEKTHQSIIGQFGDDRCSCVMRRTVIECVCVILTASISLRAFHCSYGTPRCSAVWMLQHSWLVQTFRSFSCCSSTNRARAAENYSGEGAGFNTWSWSITY